MSREICDTVKVKSPVTDENPSGFIVINAEDKTVEHELFDAAPAKEEKPAGWKAK